MECPNCSAKVQNLMKCRRCGKIFCVKCAKVLFDKKCPNCGESKDFEFIKRK